MGGRGVSALAVFLAYRIFRSEDYMRRMDAARVQQERDEHREQREKILSAHAQMVSLEVILVPTRDPIFLLTVRNQSEYPISSVLVVMEYLGIFGVSISPLIKVGEPVHKQYPAFQRPPDEELDHVLAMARAVFEMEGLRWSLSVGEATLIGDSGLV